jgi:prevent-host-death family protein
MAQGRSYPDLDGSAGIFSAPLVNDWPATRPRRRSPHERLSEHLDRVERGASIVVTRRGRPIARLSGVTGEDPLEALAQRGLITPPARSRSERRARVKPRGGSVSELIAEQRS